MGDKSLRQALVPSPQHTGMDVDEVDSITDSTSQMTPLTLLYPNGMKDVS
jgi:hypothetical protein